MIVFYSLLFCSENVYILSIVCQDGPVVDVNQTCVLLCDVACLKSGECHLVIALLWDYYAWCRHCNGCAYNLIIRFCSNSALHVAVIVIPCSYGSDIAQYFAGIEAKYKSACTLKHIFLSNRLVPTTNTSIEFYLKFPVDISKSCLVIAIRYLATSPDCKMSLLVIVVPFSYSSIKRAKVNHTKKSTLSFADGVPTQLLTF